jgi:hypothetical protein
MNTTEQERPPKPDRHLTAHPDRVQMNVRLPKALLDAVDERRRELDPSLSRDEWVRRVLAYTVENADAADLPPASELLAELHELRRELRASLMAMADSLKPR